MHFIYDVCAFFAAIPFFIFSENIFIVWERILQPCRNVNDFLAEGGQNKASGESADSPEANSTKKLK